MLRKVTDFIRFENWWIAMSSINPTEAKTIDFPRSPRIREKKKLQKIFLNIWSLRWVFKPQEKKNGKRPRFLYSITLLLPQCMYVCVSKMCRDVDIQIGNGAKATLNPRANQERGRKKKKTGTKILNVENSCTPSVVSYRAPRFNPIPHLKLHDFTPLYTSFTILY